MKLKLKVKEQLINMLRIYMYRHKLTVLYKYVRLGLWCVLRMFKKIFYEYTRFHAYLMPSTADTSPIFY